MSNEDTQKARSTAPAVIIESNQLPWAKETSKMFAADELLWLLSILSESNFKHECHASLSTMLKLNGIADLPANRKQAVNVINDLLHRNSDFDHWSLTADKDVSFETPHEALHISSQMNWDTAKGRFIRVKLAEFYAIRNLAVKERKDILVLLVLLLSIKAASVSYTVPGHDKKMAGCWLSKQMLGERCGLVSQTIGIYLELMERYGIISSISGQYLRLTNVYSMPEDRAVLPIVMEKQKEQKKSATSAPKRICMSKRGVC